MRRFAALLSAAAAAAAVPVAAQDAAARVRADREAGRPLVVHVVVALCDNDHQGIVPVPRAIGNGRDPARNLYWGARYGVRTYFERSADWTHVAHGSTPAPGVLDRVAFRGKGKLADAFLVADAWDGTRMREAVAAFLELASGRGRETLDLGGRRVAAGGASHVVAFVGHNALMDFAAPPVPRGSPQPARAAMVLACASRSYFERLLQAAGAEPLVTTSGLMAPEAYSLDAAVRAWLASGDADAARGAAAEAYDRYQKTGRRSARRLFGARP